MSSERWFPPECLSEAEIARARRVFRDALREHGVRSWLDGRRETPLFGSMTWRRWPVTCWAYDGDPALLRVSYAAPERDRRWFEITCTADEVAVIAKWVALKIGGFPVSDALPVAEHTNPRWSKAYRWTAQSNAEYWARREDAA